MVSRKMKGGAMNRMPSPNELTAPPITSPSDLQKLFKFYSIVGHGAIEPRDTGKLFLVPERTYIMFTARAGEPTEKIKPKVDAILNEFRYKHKDASKKTGLEDDKSWFERTYGTMESGTLFKDLLYDLSLEDNKDRVSIYQPGDLIQDLSVSIFNTSPPWDPVGIWELPMDPTTEDYLQSTRDDFNRIKEEFYAGAGKQIVTDITTYFNELKSQNTVAATVNPRLQAQADQLNTIYDSMVNLLLYSHRIAPSNLNKLYEAKIPQMFEQMLDDHPLLKAYIITFNKNIMELARANMIAQSAFDDKPKNILSNLMYTGTVNNQRETSVYKLVTSIPSIELSATGTESYPIYRFFLFDICRSLQEKPYPVAKRLVRTLSNVMRFPTNSASSAAANALGAGAIVTAPSAAGSGAATAVTEVYPKFNTLLKLTKGELQKLIAPLKTTVQNPTLVTLLNGQPITYKQLEQLFGTIEQYEGAFEEFIKYHRFDKGETATVIFEGEPHSSVKHLDGATVIIDSVEARVMANGGKSLFYRVKQEGAEKALPIFNRYLWKNLEDYAKAIEEREDIVTSKTRINTAYAEAEARERAEEEFDRNITHFVGLGKIVNIFKMGDTVKIEGIAQGPTHFNGLIGIIIGNDIKLSGTTEVLRYKVNITSAGQYYNVQQSFPHDKLRKVTAGGARRKSRRSKKSKQRKTRRH